jgi:uncharacterized membrane protein
MFHRPLRLAAAALLAGLAALAVTPAARAHQGHGKASPSPSPRPSPAQTASPAAVPEDKDASAEASPAAESAEASPEPVLAETTEEVPNPLSPFPWKAAFTEHLHNKIIHFPLAFGLAGALFLLAGPRFPAYEPAARVLLVGAALAAVAAFVTGRMQREPFEDTPLEQVLSIHQLLGLTTTLTLWLGVGLTARTTWRKLWRPYALLLLLVLSATGFFGGLMSHGSLG